MVICSLNFESRDNMINLFRIFVLTIYLAPLHVLTDVPLTANLEVFFCLIFPFLTKEEKKSGSNAFPTIRAAEPFKGPSLLYVVNVHSSQIYWHSCQHVHSV